MIPKLRINLPANRGFPQTAHELFCDGLEWCETPRRCSEGHLCNLWPCQLCQAKLAAESAARRGRQIHLLSGKEAPMANA